MLVMEQPGLSPEFAPERSVKPVPRWLTSIELLGFHATILLIRELDRASELVACRVAIPVSNKQERGAS
jgi:hypothetical protein